MSSALAWVEFVSPIYVGNAGYVDRVYTSQGTQGGPADCVCESVEPDTCFLRFNFKNDEFIAVPYGNIKYTYSARVEDRNLQAPQGVSGSRETPEPKRRGRPPKMPVSPAE